MRPTYRQQYPGQHVHPKAAPALALTPVQFRNDAGYGVLVLISIIGGGGKIGEAKLGYNLFSGESHLKGVVYIEAEIKFRFQKVEITLVIDVSCLLNLRILCNQWSL